MRHTGNFYTVLETIRADKLLLFFFLEAENSDYLIVKTGSVDVREEASAIGLYLYFFPSPDLDCSWYILLVLEDT